MATVRVLATRWLSDDFPGFVEFILTDAAGAEHTFQEKAAVLSQDELSPSGAYPRELWIEAEVLSERSNSVVVRLAFSIESLDGRTDFDVPVELVRASVELA